LKKDHPVPLSCSFCGKSQREVRKLIAGPTVYICDECIKVCNEILAEGARIHDPVAVASDSPPSARRTLRASQDAHRCSFCGGVGSDLGYGDRLIAGPSAPICDWCIGLCNDIVAEEIALYH